MGNAGGRKSHLPVKTILPVDIVREILSHLPAKSLLRFTCVCKTWYKLIKEEDPLLKYSKKKERLALINFNYGWRESSGKPVILTLSADPPAPTVRRVVNVDPFILKPNSTKLIRVLGVCNGIFCLYNGRYPDLKITLWNPTTREIKAVPDPSCLRKYHVGYGRGVAEVGFGFDSRNNDYKVVIIWRSTDYLRGNKPPKQSNEVEIYSLNTNSWRITKAVLPILVTTPLYFAAYLNGIHYWWYDQYKILSFSMAEEIFEMIPLPPEASAHFRVAIEVCKRHLAFVTSSSLYNIWILTEKEKGEKTWIRGDTIGPFMYASYFMGIAADDVIFLDDGKGILLYNHRTQETTRLQTSEYRAYAGSVFPYTESLVSIKGEPEPAGMN